MARYRRLIQLLLAIVSLILLQALAVLCGLFALFCLVMPLVTGDCFPSMDWLDHAFFISVFSLFCWLFVGLRHRLETYCVAKFKIEKRP